MPEYPFRRPDGEICYEWLPMEKAPSIGEEYVIDGISCVRVPSLPQVSTPKEVHFTSVSLPRHHEDAPRCNAKGQPQFESATEVREFCAKTRHKDAFGGYEHGIL